MKVCAKNKKLIVWLVMDALDAPQAAQIQAHLRQCEGCRAYRAEIASVSQRVVSMRATPEADRHEVVASRLARNPLARSRRTARHAARFARAPFNWGLVVPALSIVALSLVVLSVLLKTPSPRSRLVAINQARFKVSARTGLPPTLGNYRAVANDSFDELDDLLWRQSQKPIPAPPAPSASTVAMLQLPD
jgi:hypothetical protein